MLLDKNEGRKGQYVSQHCSLWYYLIPKHRESSMTQRTGAHPGGTLSPNSRHHGFIQKLEEGFREMWKMPCWFMHMSLPASVSEAGITGGQRLATPTVPDWLWINRNTSVIIHDFTWSLREPLLLACQKASAGLDGGEQS